MADSAGEGAISTSLPPDPARLIQALRSIGYSLNSAIADLVDNSIDAKSRNILVRFVHDESTITQIIVADDGVGMAEATLHEAMRFGAKDDAASEQLGKYGLGLKLASFSQAQSLSVASRRSAIGAVSGRRWTVEGIRRGWELDHLEADECRDLLNAPFGPVSTKSHGTAVILERLDKLQIGNRGIDETVKRLVRRLRRHLGLVFHRFLQLRDPVRLYVDSQLAGSRETKASLVKVDPIDPFGYGKDGEAQEMKADLDEGTLHFAAHIWPPNAESANYKLPGGAAKAQGLYVYRNKRLIQYGGWSGIREMDAEPHLSLARVRIDLPPPMDETFGLDLKKSSIQAPPSFVPAMQNARASDGTTFGEFLRRADALYRKRDDRAVSHQPPVVNEGVSAEIRRKIRPLLAGGGTPRPINIHWGRVERSEVFRVDPEQNQIILNQNYRTSLLQGRRASRSDAPDLKLLLFLLLREDFGRNRQSKKRRQYHQLINQLLLAVIEQEG